MSRAGTAKSSGRRFLLRHGDRILLLTLMDLVQIYQCFCDRTRLRILRLLAQSPLCVCHFQTVLDEPQVKISKHLAYLRERGMVEVEREKNWMIYSLPKKRSPELEANLKCLQDCAQSDRIFARDLKNLSVLQENCCEPSAVFQKAESDNHGKAKRPVHLRS
jgi:ArsR family transcriptional regulator, arsenate/arsenite/antimonite-responsive transcriptional repressor